MRISTRMEFFNATYFNRHWLNIYSAWYCRCRITFTANDPFLLVAVFCFARSSDRFYNWLINQKIYKEYVENFYLHRGYTLQQKIKILISLYIVIAFSIYMVDVLAVRVGLIIMVIIQTAVLFTFVKTLPKSNHKIEE